MESDKNTNEDDTLADKWVKYSQEQFNELNMYLKDFAERLASIECEKPEATVEHGTFTDPRDGNTYKTIKIGEQWWMAENLNYDIEGSKCYNNDPANGKKYGRLYTYDMAVKACPNGWCLPNNDDWDILFRFVDNVEAPYPNREYSYDSEIAGRHLKAKSGWDDYEGKSGNGIDTYGFAALPGGCFDNDDEYFFGAGSYGIWWSLDWDYEQVFGRHIRLSDRACWVLLDELEFISVRCVKDKYKRFAISNVEQGTFTDPRDGKTYKTVKIGEQWWMAENLNYEAEGSKCYGEDGQVKAYDARTEKYTKLTNAEIQANCNKYGRMYNWETAMKSCPAGWHLPTKEEWEVLMYGYPHGTSLKAKDGWDDYEDDDGNKSGNGEDTLGFSALPGGFGASDGIFYSVGSAGYWWSAIESSDSYAHHGYIYNDDENAYWHSRDKSDLLSVRCVKD